MSPSGGGLTTARKWTVADHASNQRRRTAIDADTAGVMESRPPDALAHAIVVGRFRIAISCGDGSATNRSAGTSRPLSRRAGPPHLGLLASVVRLSLAACAEPWR